ncbi:hypothetical protein GT347_02670 [Xylophilus rhododendri]|uniref:Uncharacterized protein n=1 Tax=Xylophilus rhododendri TaxID=2697032 RepID=A0A857IZF9_9BURK|nr:hypothetical protein [Xylophilus rhododendri]QHI96984.1 hypothetical protein GT347_02670 [Xylophilus rhododendri]
MHSQGPGREDTPQLPLPERQAPPVPPRVFSLPGAGSPARRSVDSGIGSASGSAASSRPGFLPTDLPVNHACVEVPRPDLDGWSVLAFARHTIFHPEHREELHRSLSLQQLAGRWREVEEAAQALGVKMFCGVYYYLAGSDREAMCQVFARIDSQRAGRYFLARTRPGQPVDRTAGSAAAAFLRLVAKGAAGDGIDRFLREFNAIVPPRKHMDIDALASMFAVNRFKAMKEARGWDEDLDKLFNTRGPHQGASFQPQYLSDGEAVTQNQAVILIQESFADRRLDRLSVPACCVLLGLLRERLTRLGNTEQLNVPAEERSMAVDLLRKVLQALQEACAAPENALRSPSSVMGEALDHTLAQQLPAIPGELWDAYQLDVEPVENLTIPMDREYRRDRELAGRRQRWEHDRAMMAGSQALWDSAGTWLHRMLASDGGELMPCSAETLDRLDLSRRTAAVFDAFLAPFQDEDLAAEKGLQLDHIPVRHWNAITGSFQPHYYNTPALAYHFMRRFCGARIDAALEQIWEEMRRAVGQQAAEKEAAFGRCMFDLAFQEFRKHAIVPGKEALCRQIALNLQHLDSRRPLSLPVFSARVLAILNANKACRKYYAAQFDADAYVADEAREAVDLGVEGAFLDRPDLLRPACESEGDPASSGNFSLDTEDSRTRRMASVHRKLQWELLSYEDGPPGVDGLAGFAQAAARGRLLDRVRSEVSQRLPARRAV